MFVGTGYLSVYTLHVVFIFSMSGLGPCVLHDETNMELICLLSLVSALMVYSLLMIQQSNFPLLIDDITQEGTIRVFAVITQQCPNSIGKYILLFPAIWTDRNSLFPCRKTTFFLHQIQIHPLRISTTKVSWNYDQNLNSGALRAYVHWILR